jgi:HEAT repeat protein
MSSTKREKLLWACVVLAVVGIGCFAGLHEYVDWNARRSGDEARQEFAGDRVDALVSLVDCAGCDLRKRSDAIWALGVIGDARALPVLRRYHTREECRHGAKLCQYELGKTIKKIEGTWGLRASLGYENTEPTSGR